MDVGELNGVVERATLMLSVAQQAGREQAYVLFSDAEISEGLYSSWAESVAWPVDAFDRCSTSANPDFIIQYEMYFGKQVPLWLLSLLTQVI